MIKRIVVCLLPAVLLLTASIATAQQTRIPLLAYLSPRSPSSQGSPRVEAFRTGLRELGYVEEKNIRIEYRYAHDKLDQLPALARELVLLKPDVIYTHTTPGVLAAKRATATIPIVVGSAGDLVARGIIASLARPGGNITGMTLMGVELNGKLLEILKVVSSKTTRVAFLVNPANPSWNIYPQALDGIAKHLGVRVQRVDAREAREFKAAFSAMIKSRVDALIVANDSVFLSHDKRIAELAATRRLPSISRSIGFAEAGGLIQYGEDLLDMSRRSAAHVDKILKGAKPADLPVEQPMKFEFIVNLKAAKQIGLTIPPNVLARADRVIK
jgi:putative ABC transport system substrate-binding protein